MSATNLKKCILSAYIRIARNYRLKFLKHLGFDISELNDPPIGSPKIWLRGAKLPPHGQGLSDKVFFGTDRMFPNFNQIRCPKLLGNREVK